LSGYFSQGLGRIYIFQQPLLVLKEMVCQRPIIIGIFPLIALMEDQVNEAEKNKIIIGVKAMTLTKGFYVPGSSARDIETKGHEKLCQEECH
jgi:hypothetical protein